MPLETHIVPPFQLHWFAAHTRSRHEKRAAEQLAGRGVEFFLPQYNVIRRWSDRRVRVSLPLFPGYVFVRIALIERMPVLEISSIVRLVGFKGQPTPLPEGEIEKLQQALSSSSGAEPHPFLTTGFRVRVIRGPLRGVEGIVQRQKDRFRVVVSVHLIKQSICVEVDAEDVQPIQSQHSTQSPVSTVSKPLDFKELSH